MVGNFFELLPHLENTIFEPDMPLGIPMRFLFVCKNEIDLVVVLYTTVDPEIVRVVE
jgi:hypothetical protein